MRILVISPFFPPSANVAIMRISSLTNHLISNGHDVTVVRNEYDNDKRISTLSDSDERLLNLRTYTVPMDEKVRYFEASNRYKKVFRELMNKEEFDLVLITAGPFYTIPLCDIAKNEYDTKCIIDYRDLWIFDLRNKIDFLKPVNLTKKALYYPIERKNISCADAVVTVTQSWSNILKKVYRTDNIHIITNGYDDHQLKSKNEVINYEFDNKFVIAAFGKLAYYSEEYATRFFEAMKILSKNIPNLLVLHIGLPEEETYSAIRNSGFDNNRYINTGFINYKDGIQLLSNVDLSIIIDVRKGAMGTKLYDYIYVNKPLIYFGKRKTYLDYFINEFIGGFSCYRKSDVINAVTKINENKISNLTNHNELENYSRSRQNKKYINLIESLVNLK
ncbi:glycosyltransferase [Halobacillus sp. KGW1]|uniref:glycosyltransferase n=1 Tax=Halobacillus sp. KGW1 TaxID=1793726 RepID=UPI00078525C0|nr:glycosyltransferase [Halobacillus sp. KGW1]